MPVFLALLQEELLDLGRRKEGHCPDLYTTSRFLGNRPMPAPPNADKTDKPVTTPGPEQRGRGVEDRLNTLRSYRRVRGLYIHCGEKWSWDHSCSENIQLHVLQEL